LVAKVHASFEKLTHGEIRQCHARILSGLSLGGTSEHVLNRRTHGDVSPARPKPRL